MNFYQQKYFRPYQRSPHRLCCHAQTDRISFQYSPDRDDNDFTPIRSPKFYKREISQSSPSFRPQESLCPLHCKDDTQPIWEHLYNEGMRSQKQLLEVHRSHQNKIDKECTFHPQICHNKRYLFPSSSTFMERVAVWQENKIQKRIKEKEQLTNKDLKECTFTPKTNKLKKHTIEEDNEIKRLSTFHNTALSTSRHINPYYSPIRQEKSARGKENIDTSQRKLPKRPVEMDKVKRMLRMELKKLKL